MQKLGIQAGGRVALVRAPAGFERALQPLPDGVRLRTQLRGLHDVVLFFATRRAELERRFPSLARGVDPTGGLWVAWPRRNSGVATDLTERLVRDVGLANGLVDDRVCTVDETWSGLCFVHRAADRRGARRAGRRPKGR